ncbi:ejaculatory bulb-specific protein 3-like [Macrosteles quadrilineatus]|uniref:ejaculatory bulb-specific protein 3-like n=1 Tax=Macrosteles quadrilineatus TaxID=74068 RepID=UPI0023E2AF04|nr:ejaculatory bulb-specific protein 3-like [Macrosteles quadrilineatus]
MHPSLLVVLVCLPAVLLLPASTYTTRFDNVNIDQILKNDRLLRNYFNCLMDRGKCTPEGEELKKAVPDALKTACAKCTPKQKEGTEKVTRFLISKRPNLYQELEKKYDPQGVYRQRYRAEAAQHGIKV